jgi:hypothetical protein
VRYKQATAIVFCALLLCEREHHALAAALCFVWLSSLLIDSEAVANCAAVRALEHWVLRYF